VGFDQRLELTRHLRFRGDMGDENERLCHGFPRNPSAAEQKIRPNFVGVQLPFFFDLALTCQGREPMIPLGNCQVSF
jgi:hypothetical protein